MLGTGGDALDNLTVAVGVVTVDLIGIYAYPAGYALSCR